MRDPHVEEIYYQVNSGEGISYDNPEPISFQNHLGEFNLNGGKLQIIPAEHFPNGDAARHALEPFLQSWEIDADLTSNIGTIRFKFEKADVIDRDPPPPGSPQAIHLRTGSMIVMGLDISAHVTKKKYPDPPNAFYATPGVQHAHRRWLGYREGKEPLQSMAYFVLTLLERAAGGRQTASNLYQIDQYILRTIGRLSSTKGNETTARKVTNTPFQELTGTEKHWLEEAIRRVIHRMGEHASGNPLTQISLSDLPDL